MRGERLLVRGRKMAEERLSETVAFYWVESGVIPDGQINPVDVEHALYENVSARLRFPTLNVSDRESAGQMVGVQDVTLSVPVGATPDVREGHMVRVTASTVDESLVGRTFRVSGSPQAGQVSSHRIPVTEE